MTADSTPGARDASVPPAGGQPAHARRDLAESFGDDADRYDRVRPHYPAALAASVLDGLEGRRVLDVGIGTGLAALPFREAGCTVLGVEVDPRMAAVARERGFEVEIGRFEQWDAAGRSFDAVISGQTWHWIDPEAGAAAAARALRPGGRLALFWNVADPDPQLAAAFAGVYRAVDTGLPFTPWATPAITGYRGILDAVEGGIRSSGGFGEPIPLRWDADTVVTKAAWLDQVPTSGGHSRLEVGVLDALLAGMGEVIDRAGGSFPMRVATIGVVAERT